MRTFTIYVFTVVSTGASIATICLTSFRRWLLVGWWSTIPSVPTKAATIYLGVTVFVELFLGFCIITFFFPSPCVDHTHLMMC
jgi:hypothetical protein